MVRHPFKQDPKRDPTNFRDLPILSLPQAARPILSLKCSCTADLNVECCTCACVPGLPHVVHAA